MNIERETGEGPPTEQGRGAPARIGRSADIMGPYASMTGRMGPTLSEIEQGKIRNKTIGLVKIGGDRRKFWGHAATAIGG